MIEDDDRPDDAADDDQALPSEVSTVDAGSKRAYRKRGRTLDQQRKDGDRFWRELLASEVGRRELWSFLALDGHAFSPVFPVGPTGFPQPDAVWFEAGRQALALQLYHRLAALDRAAILQMHDEHDVRHARPERPRRPRDET